MRKNLFVLFILLSFILPQSALAASGNGKKAAVTITAAEKKMAEAITAEQLKDYLTFIASDAMGGRDTPSAGLDITAQFLALNLKKWGFKPAGDNGTFYQNMNVVRETVESSEMMVGDSKFERGVDFVNFSGDGIEDTGLVFVKEGWLVKAKGIDAYKGLDVKNKLVVIYNPKPSRGLGGAMPDGVSNDDLKGEKGVDWADPQSYAAIKGAKGIVLILPAQQQSFIGRLSSRSGGGVEGLESESGGSIQTVLVSHKVGDAIFAGSDSELATAMPMALDKSLSYAIKKNVEKVPTQNVVAIWEGSDPVLKEEMVAVGAHYDHVGTNENAPGDDKIWNGADDDGSGTVGVLAIAEALAKAEQRPKRSILFVWHAGEEKGLWGSEYFNKFPTVDIKKVVAQLNIDMIGRSRAADDKNPKNKDLSGTNEVYVIGSEMMSSTLGAVTKETNSAYLNMTYNLKYDDPKDTNRFFFRSDHFNYAVNGIPIVFWFTGVHEDYHQASDTVDKIDFNKMEKITRTIFLTMWKISELKERPAVDKVLPKELTRRG